MSPARTSLSIQGMKDNRCREIVSDALSEISGVSQVEVSLLRARALVFHDAGLLPIDLVRAVEEVGYGAMLDE